MRLQVSGSGSVECDRCGEASPGATKALQVGQVHRNPAGMPEGQTLPGFNPSETPVGHCGFQTSNACYGGHRPLTSLESSSWLLMGLSRLGPLDCLELHAAAHSCVGTEGVRRRFTNCEHREYLCIKGGGVCFLFGLF